MVRRSILALTAVVAGLACNRRGAPVQENGSAPAPPISATAVPLPAASPPIGRDPRDAIHDVFGTPVRAGRELATIEVATNGDPQVDEAGVLVATVGGGRVVTVFFANGDFHVGGPFDLGTARFVATDGPHVCAASRNAMRCAWVDGSSALPRDLPGETTGLWGGSGIFVRASTPNAKSPIVVTADAFIGWKDVPTPSHVQVVDVEIETAQSWSMVTVPKEGNARPRLAVTSDGGATPIADAGSIDRQGWSYGDRLWPNRIVTGALSTEMLYAQSGQKQQEIELPWAAAGGFSWTKDSMVLFGRGLTGSGGFMLVELAGKRVTNVVPPGIQPIIAAGRVGDGIVAITSAGKVLGWTP